MAEHPILFTAPMVRAILDGSKTQTRRVVTWRNSYTNAAKWMLWDFDRAFVKRGLDVPGNEYLSVPFAHPDDGWDSDDPDGDCRDRVRCRWKTGDVLWVRETWRRYTISYSEYAPVEYRADRWHCKSDIPWRPSIHMPRWASRISLRITGVQVQRVQEISEEDAIAEGCQECPDCQAEYQCGEWGRGAIDDPLSNAAGGRPWSVCMGLCGGKSARQWYRETWDAINAKRGFPWAGNPWVWALTFQREGAE